MGMFDTFDQKSYDAFRSEVYARFESLTKEIRGKATDSDETARNAAQNCVDIESRLRQLEMKIEAAAGEFEVSKELARSEVEKIQEEKTKIFETNDKINTYISILGIFFFVHVANWA